MKTPLSRPLAAALQAVAIASKQPKFSLGQVVITQGASAALLAADVQPLDYITRHVFGDWGEVDEADRRENEVSLQHGFRLLSAYTLTKTAEKIWIITEADRSVTTLLLPCEY